MSRPNLGTSSCRYAVQVSTDTHAPDWDAFLAETPGGQHVQTSLWARVKAVLGWRATRVVVTHEQQIVGGLQLLTRRTPLLGTIGFVSKGPLVAVDDPAVVELAFRELDQITKSERIRYVMVQPPNSGLAWEHALSARGFRASCIEVAPRATVQIDLRPHTDQLLAAMRKSTRKCLRRSQPGLIAREGTGADLPVFYRLLSATSQRQGFRLFSENYFAEMWRILQPPGYARLFLVEYQGEPVAAQLVVPFGDTVIAKNSGWSGQHGNLAPNQLLDWTTIQWSKFHGYHYYDLEGIKLKVAQSLLETGTVDDEVRRSPAFYKLGFGGQLVILPPAYDRLRNPVLNRAYHFVYPRIADWPITRRLLHGYRTR
jgi:lipid II:glycine glycyltransferase (peptidoglycan interpeptide bridge formation enzyme)